MRARTKRGRQLRPVEGRRLARPARGQSLKEYVELNEIEQVSTDEASEVDHGRQQRRPPLSFEAAHELVELAVSLGRAGLVSWGTACAATRCALTALFPPHRVGLVSTPLKGLTVTHS
jgi:hypothetical protein